MQGVRFGEWKDVPTFPNPVTLSNQLNIEHITWSSRSDSTTNAPVEPVEYWTLPHNHTYAVLVRPYHQWLLTKGGWPVSTLVEYLLYVHWMGQDHQSILDDLSGWPVRTLVKYFLCVCHIGQDHQSILDDLSGWLVSTMVGYLLYVCQMGQDHQSILNDLSGWPVRTPVEYL